MTTSEIRKKFLNFFKDKGHTIVQSDLLVPKDDPTLLFTGAGMNQFKKQFMGRDITFKRATSCQKCLRTADIENVGKTPRHHTFFEMLGNFSFGDYFKKEAIEWGWEFMTKVMNIPAERLWVSVYSEDEESYSIWLNEVKIPAGKIVKLGAHDNFWPANAPKDGPNGPCGPCSEIFYDWGTDIGCGSEKCDPSCDCGRFVEVWNLVFTEFERKPDGKLEPLPNKNIDTGMGLERMASVVQNVKTNFETDIFSRIIDEIKKELAASGKDADDKNVYLIADHIRAITFTICDGVSPSNEKQGYVIRKLLRRAYLKSGMEEPFLYNLIPVIASAMKDAYPEVKEKAEHISAIVKEDEKKFKDTLNTAMPVMDNMISENKSLTGEQVFKLVDTYGLPLDIVTKEIEERGISFDIEEFNKLMDERKDQSRRGSDISGDFIFKPDHFASAPKPDYSLKLPLEAKLEFILKDGAALDEISEGDRAEIIISPQSSQFYAESGGQVGDTGTIIKSGGEMSVINTFEAEGRTIFGVHVNKGQFTKGDGITLSLNEDKKALTARNHTATHLLQSALRVVLGEHVKQSGSFVNDKRLRFDFTHMKKVSDRELIKIEDMVNEWVDKSVSVSKETKSLTEAKGEGALSFFGEKYGDTVRVVTVGDHSKELCGGTHVDNTQDIELVKITGESSVASGLRRIEAVTSDGARAWVKNALKELLSNCKAEGEILNYANDVISGKKDIDKKVIHDFTEEIRPALLKERERLEKEAKKQQKKEAADVFNKIKERLDKIAASCEKAGGINFASDVLPEADMSTLKKAAGYLEKKITSGVVLVGSGKDDKAYLICAVTSDLAEEGLSAKEIVGTVAGRIDGSGGGKETFAQAGGKNPDGLKEAIEAAKKIIQEKRG